MVRIEKSVEIRAPPRKVWEMLAFDRMPEWMDEWKSAKYTAEVRTSKDKYRAGTSAHVTQKHGEFDLEITEILKNEKIIALSKGMGGGRVTMTVTYTMKPAEEGTKLTYAMDYEMPGGTLGKTLNKLFGGFGEKHAEKGVERSLDNLKSALEK